jgi:hypothetical protein
MPSPSRTLFARGTRVTLAAAALTVALAGCTVEVSGTAAPRPATPVAVPGNATVPTTAPRSSTPSVPTSSIDPAVYAEWVAAGWTPTTLQRVQDPDSLTSAQLLGTPEYTPLRGANGEPSPATHYYVAKGAPASVFTDFMVHPYPVGATPDLQRTATAMAEGMGGFVVSAQPLTVSGYPGLDVRIEATTDNGRPFVALIRLVKLPEHLVALGAAGAAADDRVIGQVHEIIVDTLRLPSV